MNWIFYSLLMFIASVALYLTVRKSSLEKVPIQLTNLAMFAIPLLIFSVMSLNRPSDLHISWPLAALLLVVAIVCAYGGNKASLHAIDVAPNPGYSLVLSKSYVLFTTIVAVALLHAELNWRKAVAIILIVAFSALIMINRKGGKHVTSTRWIWLSLGSFFAWGLLSLSSKYLFNHGLTTIAFLVYLYLIVTVCIVVIDKIRLADIRAAGKPAVMLLLATGAFSTLFNYGQFQAIHLAPNVGYVNAANAASIALVTVMAVILFKDELTKRKALGVFGVTVGLVLLLI